MTVNENGQEQRDPGLLGKFMQGAKFSAFERLLCTHILESINAAPLTTISHITRASLILDEEQAEKTGIDQENAKQLYTISQRLATSPRVSIDGEAMYMIHLETVDWEEEIKPWARMKSYECTLTPREQEEYDKILEDEDYYELAIFAAKRLTETGYMHLVSDFLVYAMPVIEDMSRRLSGLVNAETYTELMKMTIGERAHRG